jgi:hypothetical protein
VKILPISALTGANITEQVRVWGGVFGLGFFSFFFSSFDVFVCFALFLVPHFT